MTSLWLNSNSIYNSFMSAWIRKCSICYANKLINLSLHDSILFKQDLTGYISIFKSSGTVSEIKLYVSSQAWVRILAKLGLSFSFSTFYFSQSHILQTDFNSSPLVIVVEGLWTICMLASDFLACLAAKQMAIWYKR